MMILLSFCSLLIFSIHALFYDHILWHIKLIITLCFIYVKRKEYMPMLSFISRVILSIHFWMCVKCWGCTSQIISLTFCFPCLLWKGKTLWLINRLTTYQDGNLSRDSQSKLQSLTVSFFCPWKHLYVRLLHTLRVLTHLSHLILVR